MRLSQNPTALQDAWLAHMKGWLAIAGQSVSFKLSLEELSSLEVQLNDKEIREVPIKADLNLKMLNERVKVWEDNLRKARNLTFHAIVNG